MTTVLRRWANYLIENIGASLIIVGLLGCAISLFGFGEPVAGSICCAVAAGLIASGTLFE